MTVGLDVRLRVVAPVLILGAAALALGGFMLTRPPGAQTSDPAPAKRASVSKSSVAPAWQRHDAVLDGTAAAATAARRPTVERPAPRPDATDSGVPARIATALRRDEVVVVSVVSPEAALDEMSLQEARAGAKRSGAGFVAISMLEQPDAKALAGRLDVRHTPAVLVFARPDRLFVQIDGFADRETVAQAAANAAP